MGDNWFLLPFKPKGNEEFPSNVSQNTIVLKQDVENFASSPEKINVFNIYRQIDVKQRGYCRN